MIPISDFPIFEILEFSDLRDLGISSILWDHRIPSRVRRVHRVTVFRRSRGFLPTKPPEVAPKTLPDGPKTLQEVLKTPQDGPKTTQDRPKTPQDGPEAPERRPDMSQDEPRRLKMDLPKLTRAPAVRFSVRCLDSRDVLPITRPCARLANQSELKGAHGCLFMSVITQSIKQSTNQPINLSTYQ